MEMVDLPTTNDEGLRGSLSVWLDSRGQVEQVWCIQRLTPIEFRVVGDTLGVVCQVEGPVYGAWVAPINPVTGTPYFKARTTDVLDALDELSGVVRFSTGPCLPVDWRKQEGEASCDWGGVSPQLDLPEGQATHGQEAAARVNESKLELYAEIGGPECVTVRVSGIALGDFDAVCQSVRDAFLPKVA